MGDMENAVACPARLLWMAVGAQPFRRLGQSDEEGGFRRGEPLRWFAKPGAGAHFDALNVTAVGGDPSIEGENLGLAVASLQGDCALHLL